MSISVCLVARNHGHCLGRALASVAGWAAEVVVVETGSTDDTAALARNHGARVVEVTWADDFAAACNAALDAATGDWVLLLNPDEELEPDGRPLLSVIAGDYRVFAASVRVRQELRPDRRDFGTVDREPRFYRRDAIVRYRGRLHPRIEPPLDVLAAGRLQKVIEADATIRRHAYLSPPTPDKMRWVVRLLEAELRDRPGQLPLLIELGRNLLALSDPRGHDVLAEASEQVRPHLLAPAAPSPMVGSLLEYLLVVAPEQNRTGITPEQARDLAGRWFARTPPVVWALAGERFAAEDFARAVAHLERLLEFGRTGNYDPAGGFDVDILGPSALLNLAICHYKLGHWEQAKVHAAAILDDPARGAHAQRLYAAATKAAKQ